jgi:hypothetical protein
MKVLIPFTYLFELCLLSICSYKETYVTYSLCCHMCAAETCSFSFFAPKQDICSINCIYTELL